MEANRHDGKLRPATDAASACHPPPDLSSNLMQRADESSVGVYVQPTDIERETQVAVEFKVGTAAEESLSLAESDLHCSGSQAFPEHNRKVCLETGGIQDTFKPKSLGSGLSSFLDEAKLRRIGTVSHQGCVSRGGDTNRRPLP